MTVSIYIQPYDEKHFTFLNIIRLKDISSFVVFNKFELLTSQGNAALRCGENYYTGFVANLIVSSGERNFEIG